MNKRDFRKIKELKRPKWFEIEVKKVELDPEDKIMLEDLLKDFN